MKTTKTFYRLPGFRIEENIKFQIFALTEWRTKMTCSSNWHRKSIWQNSNIFHDKNFQLGIEGDCLHIIKTINKDHKWKVYSKYHIQCWKTESFSSKVKNKAKMPVLTVSIQHSIENCSQSNEARKRQEKELKDI